MPLVQADHLSRIGAALLRAAGASDEEAIAVATSSSVLGSTVARSSRQDA